MSRDPFPELEPIARVIAQQLAARPEHFITHPAELKLFESLTEKQLEEFAVAHGWSVIRRVGGHRIEFYNDARNRLERERHPATVSRKTPGRD